MARRGRKNKASVEFDIAIWTLFHLNAPYFF